MYTYIHTYIHTGELMAIKEVDCSRAGEAAISDLEAEITMLQQLRHPNIGREPCMYAYMFIIMYIYIYT